MDVSFGFHHRTEFVLFGYKGKIEIYPKRKAIPTVFDGKSERHSAKPDEFYQLVQGLGKNRVDVFARREREGWDVLVTKSTTLLIWNGIVAMAYNGLQLGDG